MPYATQAEIELSSGGAARLNELADFDGDGVADPTVIARAQEASESFINPYLLNRYAIPLENPSKSLIRLAADEAVYQIKRWRGMVGQLDVDDRKERERELEDYQKGIRRPDEPAPARSSTARSAWVDVDADNSPVSKKGTEGMW